MAQAASDRHASHDYLVELLFNSTLVAEMTSTNRALLCSAEKLLDKYRTEEWETDGGFLGGILDTLADIMRRVLKSGLSGFDTLRLVHEASYTIPVEVEGLYEGVMAATHAPLTGELVRFLECGVVTDDDFFVTDTPSGLLLNKATPWFIKTGLAEQIYSLGRSMRVMGRLGMAPLTVHVPPDPTQVAPTVAAAQTQFGERFRAFAEDRGHTLSAEVRLIGHLFLDADGLLSGFVPVVYDRIFTDPIPATPTELTAVLQHAVTAPLDHRRRIAISGLSSGRFTPVTMTIRYAPDHHAIQGLLWAPGTAEAYMRITSTLTLFHTTLQKLGRMQALLHVLCRQHPASGMLQRVAVGRHKVHAVVETCHAFVSAECRSIRGHLAQAVEAAEASGVNVGGLAATHGKLAGLLVTRVFAVPGCRAGPKEATTFLAEVRTISGIMVGLLMQCHTFANLGNSLGDLDAVRPGHVADLIPDGLFRAPEKVAAAGIRLANALDPFRRLLRDIDYEDRLAAFTEDLRAVCLAG